MGIVDLVDKLKEYSILTDEEYKALLQTEDPLLRDKLFRGAQEAMNYVFHRRVYFQGVLEFSNHGSIINVGVLWTLLFTRPLVLR